VERYSNGTAKRFLLNYINFTLVVSINQASTMTFAPFVSRYVLGDDSQLQTFLVEEERSTTPNRFQNSHSPDERLSWLPDTIKDFILPSGFPGG